MTQRPASVTIIDVAREAGVSKSAAARVLARNGSASPRTKEKVLAAAERLGYRPNQLAKAMKSGLSHTIGVVVPDVANPFFSAVLRGFSDAARSAGFEVLVSNTDNDSEIEASSIELLAEKRVDGIAIAPVLQEAPLAIARISEEGVPVVLLDRRLPTLDALPLVSADHADATQQAIHALTAQGHSRIALVTEAPQPLDELVALSQSSSDETLTPLRPSTQRVIGYLRALAAAGITPEDALIIRSAYSIDAAQRAVESFFDDDHGATAMHSTDAALTSGAYRAFGARGVLLPDDLSFIGFDDQDWTTLVRPSVSVIDQPRQRLGATAATTLIGAIRGYQTESRDHLLRASLLMRESTAPCARK